jgi:thiamine biosynthesis lipoprotein
MYKEVYDLAQVVTRETDGAFDITVAPLSDLWDFKSPDASIPDAEDIAKEAAKVDASKVHLDGNTLSFDSRDTMIDLGALVKGYAADEMAAYLKSEGVSSGLINLGGNVLTIGSKPDGSMWRIGIRKPFDSDAIIDTVEVSDQTVVSSGVYERYFEQDGVIYHHILDPDTGYPIENGIWGDSIICSSSLQGDALSTTCLALGVEKASKLIESLDGVEAVFINDRLELTKAGEAD